MTHFRAYLYKQKSNAGQTFSTFLICNNKPYGSNISLVSFCLPRGAGQYKGLLRRGVIVAWLLLLHSCDYSSLWRGLLDSDTAMCTYIDLDLDLVDEEMWEDQSSASDGVGLALKKRPHDYMHERSMIVKVGADCQWWYQSEFLLRSEGFAG